MTYLPKIARLMLLSATIGAGRSLLVPSVPAAVAQEAAPAPAEDSDDGAVVIEAGKEEVLGAMLGQGAALPEGCTFESGQIERTFIKSTYKCGGSDVVLEIVHPDKAKNAVASTKKFAIGVVSGTPPNGLIDGVVSRMRAREAEFEWKVIERRAAVPSSSRKPLLAAAGALALVVVVLVLRRRSAATKA